MPDLETYHPYGFNHSECKRSYSRFNHGYHILCAILILIGIQGYSQELEPRSMVNLPVGTSFAMAGYGFASGNILYDPAVPLENVNAKTHTLVGAYVRSVNFFGMAAKANVILPFAAGDWDGNFQGVDTATSRTGMGDLRLGFSFNFLGSPALSRAGFKDYEQKTISGFSLQIVVPTGQYFEDKLVNIGSNRWAFRPQFGISHRINTWHFEMALNAWFYTENHSFWDGSSMKQKPIGTIKMNMIKSFDNGIWVSLGAGYAKGGRVYLNDEKRDSNISVMRLGVISTFPIHPKHSLKLSALTAVRFEQGADFDALSIAYQYMWMKN